MVANAPKKWKLTPIKDIQIGDNRRPIDPGHVKTLADSIRLLGLFNPVAITPDMRLIHGGHRVEAFLELDRDKIPAVTLDLDCLHVELAEIDENLVSNPLTALEKCECLVRRQEVYKQLGLVSSHGGARKGKSQGSSGENCHLKSYADEAAKLIDRSARTVRQYVAVADKISKDLRDLLRTTPVADRISDLEKLSQLPRAEQQAVVERIVAGDQTVAVALEAIEKNASQADGGTNESASKSASEPPSEPAPTDTPVGAEEDSTADSTFDVAQGENSIDAEDELEDDIANEVAESQSRRTDTTVAPQDAAVLRYREILEELPEMVDFLSEHIDGVVGKGLAPETVVSRLDEAIATFEAVRDAEELQRNETPCAETDS